MSIRKGRDVTISAFFARYDWCEVFSFFVEYLFFFIICLVYMQKKVPLHSVFVTKEEKMKEK